MTTYIGITIGPIYKTFTRVRKTRELWAVSMSFSLLAKYLIEELLEAGVHEDRFVLPFVKLKRGTLEGMDGVGLYPDRIIFQSVTGNRATVKAAIAKAVGRLSAEISQQIGKEQESIKNALLGYFKVYFVEKEIDENAVEPTKSKPILAISPLLDQAELQNRYQRSDAAEEFLREFFERVDEGANGLGSKYSFLREHFGKSPKARDANKQIRVPSLIEIGTIGLRDNPRSKYTQLLNDLLWEGGEAIDEKDVEFVKELQRTLARAKDESFKSFHKYVCILNVDGDKIGETLKHIPLGEESKFSQSLLDWGKAAYSEIIEYGGLPIYIGGDDLLCIAPVANGDRNVLDLVSSIKKAFAAAKVGGVATLSFGVSITYYKFPLSEALAAASDLLYKAKEAGGDATAIRLLKHSGSEFDAILSAKGKVAGAFERVLHTMNDDKAFNSSVAFHLYGLEGAYSLVGKDETRVWNMFRNHFDEANEATNPKYRFLIHTKELVGSVFSAYSDAERGRAMKDVYSYLRLARFINGQEDAEK